MSTKLTSNVRRLRRKYTRLVNFGKHGHSAFLQIDHQGFEVVSGTTKKRAKWFQDMLASSLDRLIRNEGGKQ